MSSARKRSAVPVLMFFLLTCAGNVYGLTRGVVLTWDAPVTTNVIAVYHVYYGTKSGSYTNSVTADDPSGLVIKDLQGDMTYYFAVSATDTAGNNSPLSTEASVTLLNPKPVKLETEVYTDDNGLPFAMTITGTNTTTTDWELDYSTDLVNWTYLTGDHGIDIYQVVYFSDADQMFFRLMDY
ncbi:MAG: fibronectin type III domain-containing protein [Verrucomicrobiae bacterium]|nr:fibronectin type III domain-containing protein [Verrucomicrobiae bacterium]